MISYLINEPWLLVLLAISLHLADYALTIRGARLYAAQDRIKSEGSYELNPAFAHDVDNLRRISPKFLLRLGLSAAIYIALAWSFQAYSTSEDTIAEASVIFFNMLFGMAIGMLVYIIERHLLNIFLFRNLATPSFADGRLHYPRSSNYAISAAMFKIQSAAALFYAVLLGEPFFAGTALMMWVLGQQHTALGKRAASEEGAAARGEILPPEPSAVKQVVRLLLLLAGALVATILLLILLAYLLG